MTFNDIINNRPSLLASSGRFLKGIEPSLLASSGRFLKGIEPLQSRLNDGSQGILEVKGNWVVKTCRPDSFDDPARELQFLKVGAAEGITPKGFLKGDSLYVRLIDNGLSLREVLEGFSAGLITLVQLEDVIEEVVNAFYILHSRIECCQVDSHSGNTMVYEENNQFKVALIDFGQGEWIDNWEEGINDFYILGSDIQGLAPQVYEFFCELVVELGYPSPDILSNPDSFSG